MADIAYQNKDIASKRTCEALVGRSLSPFGLPHLKIVDMLPTNLPTIESNELRLDNLFLLNDGSLAIIDYESKYDRTNFVKYINYIARVLRRYELQNKLAEVHEIRMVVIYTADVEYAEETYHLGSITLHVESAYLVNMNSNHIYQKLRNKIENHETLTEEELTELMILPLTAAGLEKKKTYIEKAVHLAKQLPNRSDTLSVLSGLLTFTDKIIDDNYAQQIKEEYFMMTKVEKLIYDEACEKITNRITKEVTERVTNEVTAKVTAEVTESVTASVTERVTASVTARSIASAIQMCKNLHINQDEILRQLVANFAISKEAALSHLQNHPYNAL